MKAKYLTLIGTALTLLATGNVAVAQTSNSPAEIKLSPEGMRILCERFPLNSRCNGNGAAPTSTPAPMEEATPTTPTDTTAPEEMTEPSAPTDTTAPEEMTEPDTDSPGQ